MTSEESGKRTGSNDDPVDYLLDQISGEWGKRYPTVLRFNDEDKSVVADVNGDLRLLSSALVYAREVDKEDVRKAYDRHGRPALVSLKTQWHRFDKEMFEDTADLEGTHV